MSVVDFSRCTRSRGPGIEFCFQLLIYNDDAADHVVNDDAGYVADDDDDDVVNDDAGYVADDDDDHVVNGDAGYVADDDGRNRFISTTTVGPRAFKLSSGLPALPWCLRLPASHQDHRHNRHFVEIVIKIIIMIIKIIVKIVILSKSLSGSSS